ncbi:hypothetical protein SGRI78S_01827 [Streptomyces griseus subsp. griseus]
MTHLGIQHLDRFHGLPVHTPPGCRPPGWRRLRGLRGEAVFAAGERTDRLAR